jgi:hypothetical protein
VLAPTQKYCSLSTPSRSVSSPTLLRFIDVISLL